MSENAKSFFFYVSILATFWNAKTFLKHRQFNAKIFLKHRQFNAKIFLKHRQLPPTFYSNHRHHNGFCKTIIKHHLTHLIHDKLEWYVSFPNLGPFGLFQIMIMFFPNFSPRWDGVKGFQWFLFIPIPRCARLCGLGGSASRSRRWWWRRGGWPLAGSGWGRGCR